MRPVQTLGVPQGYNAPVCFTYSVPVCVRMIAGNIQMGKNQHCLHTTPIVVYAPLLNIKPHFILTKLI